MVKTVKENLKKKMQQGKDASSSNQMPIKNRTSSSSSPPKHNGENNRTSSSSSPPKHNGENNRTSSSTSPTKHNGENNRTSSSTSPTKHNGENNRTSSSTSPAKHNGENNRTSSSTSPAKHNGENNRTSSSTSPPKHNGENNRSKELQSKVTSAESNENLKSKSSKSNSSNDFVCRACEEPIKGLIVKALGETWHQEHFLCSECKKPIMSNKFNVEEGKPYCEDDYANLFLKKCQGCKAPIRDVVVIALNQTWHKDHFVCIMCGTKLAHKGFFERENNPFCHQCFEDNFCPRCNECNGAITNTAIVALGKKWHQECFKCSNCQKPILESTFEIVSSRPICANCSTSIVTTI